MKLGYKNSENPCKNTRVMKLQCVSKFSIHKQLQLEWCYENK